MNKQRAERGGIDRAEDSTPTICAVPTYGTGNGSWRERHKHIFATDAQARWFIDSNRGEFQRVGALAMFKNRLFCLEPTFTQTVLRLARAQLESNADRRQRSSQEVADAFLSRHEPDIDSNREQVEALQQALEQ